MRITSGFTLRLPLRLPTLGLIAVLACAFVVAACGTTTSGAGSGGTSPTATTAPTAASTNTVPAPTNTPSGPQAAVSITTSGGAYGGGNFGFSPSSLSIKAGTTVTWTDMTGAPHTVTSDAGDPAPFNGSLSGDGATFSFTFTTSGTYKYHCSIHPYMTATITVTA
jgi:plastocyanin